MDRITDTLREMGPGFAFVGRQVGSSRASEQYPALRAQVRWPGLEVE